MATKTTKTKVTEIISEQKRVNNSGNDARLFDIEALVNVSYGKFQNINSGVVKKNDSLVANFDATESATDVRGLKGTIDDKMAVITAIDEFVNDVKTEQTGVTL